MRICDNCGAALDPQEICDCRKVLPEDTAIACVTPPVIAENIYSVTAYVTQVVDKLTQLSRDKEGCAAAKAMRAELRRKFDEMEEQRKTVKKAVLEPYNAAERKYKEQISGPMQAADQQLKDWIDSYQNGVKQACQAELEDYFYELCAALHIDFVTFADTGVKVDMATANLQDPRKARNAIHDFLNRIEEDLRTIAGMENAAEVLAEYKVCKSLSAAISAVNERKSRIAAAVDSMGTARAHLEAQNQHRKVLAVEAPEIIPEKEKIYTTAFSITDTLARLRAIKAFLDGNGYVYKEVITNE